jgi:3-hydroxybutyryl-CoA dehydratase
VNVGDKIAPLRRTVDQQQIDRWADVSGDRNPLHVDVDYARGTQFGGTIAHGHLSLAWLGEMLLAWCGPAWVTGGELVGVRFVGPVRPGATVRAEGEVVEIVDGGRRVRCDIRVVDDETGDLRVVGQALVPVATSQRGAVA